MNIKKQDNILIINNVELQNNYIELYSEDYYLSKFYYNKIYNHIWEYDYSVNFDINKIILNKPKLETIKYIKSINLNKILIL